MQPVVMTTAANNKQQRDIFARQTMNTAIMAGGAIVQVRDYLHNATVPFLYWDEGFHERDSLPDAKRSLSEYARCLLTS